MRFASIGVVSTVVFALLFALLDGPLGAVGADVVALARVRVRQHRGQPPADVRAARARRARAALRRAASRSGCCPLGLTLAALAVLSALGGDLAARSRS